ncbi:hypothetical protein MXB_4877, partial [Myxobolus squamalis]
MPNKDAIHKVIQQRRNKIQVVPPRPREQNETQTLLLGLQSSSKWSHLIEKLSVDKTFSLETTLFLHIYVIMAAREGFVLLVLFALLPDKEGKTFLRLFEAIKELCPNLNPFSISIDFEQTAIRFIRTTFPNYAIHRCLFHLTKT